MCPQGTTYNGYLAFCAAVHRTVVDGKIPLTEPQFYADLNAENLDEFLMGDGAVPCPLVPLRLQCLKGERASERASELGLQDASSYAKTAGSMTITRSPSLHCVLT